MKLMRWAMCVAAFAFAGEFAMSEDYVDVSALQAKLAAQEARLNDLQAKVYGNACDDSGIVADGITSLRKNATVTIGGFVQTRYDYRNGKIQSAFVYDGTRDQNNDLYNGNDGYRGNANGMRFSDSNPVGGRDLMKTRDFNRGNLAMADTVLEGKIDVNEYFDAYFQFELMNQDGEGNVGHAKNYWVRWKNICNSGFGVLVGRDSLKYGGIAPYGIYDSWTHGISDMSGDIWGGGDGDRYNTAWFNGLGSGMSIQSGMPTRGTLGANSRTTQITPYWENQSGTFKAEVSIFSQVQDQNANTYVRDYNRFWGNASKLRHNNDGLGTFSAKLTWKPVDGLTVVGSVMNQHARHYGAIWNYPQAGSWDGIAVGDANNPDFLRTSRNSVSTYLGFEYRPAFFNKMNLFATWNHGWNDGWIKDQDSDSFAYGVGFDIGSGFTLYAVGEHMIATSKQAGRDVLVNDAYNIHKAKGWSTTIGFNYDIPCFPGATLSGGWRHERMDYKNRAGWKHTKLKGDAFRLNLGFAF